MAITYSHDFTAANGTLLTALTADTGQSYSGSSAVGIQDNAVTDILDSGATQFVTVDGLSTAGEYEIRGIWLDKAGGGSADIMFGGDAGAGSSATDFYLLRVRSDQIILFEVIDGAFNQLGSPYSFSVAVTSNTEIIICAVTASGISVSYGANADVISEPTTTHTKESGLSFRVQGNTDTTVGYWLDSIEYEATASAAPTITDINTNNQVTPGATATLTGTNLTNATGVTIGSVSQVGFSVVSDTSVTFTGTRGGNPYNQDLTATLLSPDGNATITVQQVPEAGTFAVTAASPNTTDDASLWSGLVDTSTGDPVTVVDGDQAWVNTLLDGLAIAPDGTITANETGTFTVQFWRASEGVWGSDQTVSFTLPAEVDDWPYHKNIRYRAEKTWTWGPRHPKTSMRVRIFD